MAELVYAADLKSAGLNNLVGSSPTSPTIKALKSGDVAHLVERSIRIAEVGRSSRLVSTTFMTNDLAIRPAYV